LNQYNHCLGARLQITVSLKLIFIKEEIVLEVPHNATPQDIVARLADKYGDEARRLMYYPDGSPCYLVTVNNQVVTGDATLEENDHLKILGLFSGG
jgi:sulfur carrier protein ThiS